VAGPDPDVPPEPEDEPVGKEPVGSDGPPDLRPFDAKFAFELESNGSGDFRMQPGTS
jgi:hypothetical protein